MKTMTQISGGLKRVVTVQTTAKIEWFFKAVQSRNKREILVGILLLPAFGYLAGRAAMGSLTFYAYVLLIIGILFVIGIIWKVASIDGDLINHPADKIDFWTGEIYRQERLLRLVPVWYLGPFIPGLALIVWSERTRLEGSPIILIVVYVSVFAIIALLNTWGASKLKRLAISLEQEQANKRCQPTA